MSATTVDEVLDLYRRWGGDGYDESLSQLDHALQTAALAADDGAADSLVAAALLHDVGSLLHYEAARGAWRPPSRDHGHEAVGARHLGRLFPPAVTRPVALHVRAKRYLCAVDPGYHDRLSEGSQRSLALQGGPMNGDEAAAFERSPGHDDAVRLRTWDDLGKVLGLAVPGLDTYRPLLLDLATDRR